MPYHFPFWAGILAAIVEKKGGDVGILDLNAVRMDFDNNKISDEMIEEEIAREDWDLIGIGGLTSTYKRIIIPYCWPFLYCKKNTPRLS